MQVTVRPLSPACGAEVVGVGLAQPLDPETVREIERAFLEHIVLVFRDQSLDEAGQLRFGNYFGTEAVRKRSPSGNTPGGDQDSAFMLVTNIVKDGQPIGSFGDGEMWFHHDTSYYENPNKLTLLYAQQLPSWGGNTRFSNMYKAYENVPEDLKRRLEGRKVLQMHDYKRRERLDAYSLDINSILHCVQPIFVTHPVTRRKALYVSRLMSARIEGFSRAESERTLERLFDISEDPSIVYEHKWRLGDLVMWDNYASIHARTDFPRDQPRLMRRLTLEGHGALS